jgi:hypothetical protein
LPHLVTHPEELAANIKRLAKRLLKDQDYKALQEFDFDLYQLPWAAASGPFCCSGGVVMASSIR